MQRLLERLDREIAQGRVPRELPFLRAERAVLLVRQGEIGRARQELLALRALPEAQTNQALVAWLALGDGLAQYFDNLAAGAEANVQRAHRVAAAAKAPRIQALAAAWCAHMAFHRQDHAAVVDLLQQAFRAASPENHSAQSRASVVMANLCLFAGREDLAQPWYVRARLHASIEGDGATLSSITYNLTALRVIHVRLAEAFGEMDIQAARRALVGVESSVFLDRSVRTLALSSLTSMQRAQILAANGQLAEALLLYERDLPRALDQGVTGSEALYRADQAWCLVQLGRGDEARTVARHAATALAWSSDVDERAVTHALLARVFGTVGLADESRRHAEQSLAEWQAYGQRCQAIVQMVDAVDWAALVHSPRSRAA